MESFEKRSEKRRKSPEGDIEKEFNQEIVGAYKRAVHEADNPKDVKEILKKMEAILVEAGTEFTPDTQNRLKAILKAHGF